MEGSLSSNCMQRFFISLFNGSLKFWLRIHTLWAETKQVFSVANRLEACKHTELELHAPHTKLTFHLVIFMFAIKPPHTQVCLPLRQKKKKKGQSGGGNLFRRNKMWIKVPFCSEPQFPSDMHLCLPTKEVLQAISVTVIFTRVSTTLF